jgi:hypothetical protein
VLLSVIGIVNLALIGRLLRSPRPDVVIDWRGAALSSVGIILCRRLQLPERVGVLRGHRAGTVRHRRPVARAVRCS